MKKNAADCIARVIRTLTDPPYTGGLFVLILGAVRRDLFTSPWQWVLLLLFLGVIPAPAYIVRPRNGRIQQLLPFLILIASYSAAALWAVCSGAGPQITMVCVTYCLSVLLLAVLNLFLRVHASGHVCGMAGPLVLLMYLTQLQQLWIGLPLLGILIWASVRLRIHTIPDVLEGCLVFGSSFMLALVMSGML